MEFKDIDFQILKFIEEEEFLYIKKLFKKFPEERFCTEYRLQMLFEYRYIRYSLDEVQNKFFVEYLVLTNRGKKALQDYQFERDKDKKNFKKEILKLSLAAALGYLAKNFIDKFFT